MRLPIAFLDIVFQVLICFVVLFVLDFIQPKSPKATVETAKPRAEFIITATWDSKLNSDIDLWALREENLKSFTYYNNRENDVFILHNDNTSSQYGQVDGVPLSEAKETMTIEKSLRGTYLFSLHGFRVEKPTKVTFEIVRVSPFKELIKKEVTFTAKEHQKEIPMFEFVLGEDGSMVSSTSDVFFLREIWRMVK